MADNQAVPVTLWFTQAQKGLISQWKEVQDSLGSPCEQMPWCPGLRLLLSWINSWSLPGRSPRGGLTLLSDGERTRPQTGNCSLRSMLSARVADSQAPPWGHLTSLQTPLPFHSTGWLQNETQQVHTCWMWSCTTYWSRWETECFLGWN